MIRRKLQAGFGRRAATIIAGLGMFSLVLYHWDLLRHFGVNPLDVLPKVAFVAAAFSVTAYNLRTRVIDLSMKVEGAPERVREICGIARNCGKRLTNLVLLFTITALFMGALGVVPPALSFGKWAAAATFSAFVASIVQFVYVIFAFERLERFMMDDTEAKAQEKEAKRLLSTG
jgi:hypothetical protein